MPSQIHAIGPDVDDDAVPTYDVVVTTADGPIAYAIPTYDGPSDARRRAVEFTIALGLGAILGTRVDTRPPA